MRAIHRIAAAILAMACGIAAAQPGVYYLWKHNTTGQTMCEPEADKNWTKVSGPYEDPNCQFPTKQ